MKEAQNSVKGDILLVDDNPNNLKLLGNILTENGFQVRASVSGGYALKSIKNDPPDLILLDIKMPEMDGYEVCRQLKTDPLSHHVPVIFLSALMEEESKVKAFEVGGVDYITKPFHSQEILARVRTHLSMSFMQHRLEEMVREKTVGLVTANEELQKDITERKKVEEALRESRLRLELALRSSNIALWDWDLNTNDIYFSPEWKTQIGYGENEIENHYDVWESRLHPEDREEALSELRDYLDGRTDNYMNEFRLRHKDGSYRWIFSNGEMLRNSDGEPASILGCQIDITKRKLREKALQESKRKLTTLIGNLPGIAYRCAHDEAWTMEFISEGCLELTGYEPDIFIGNRIMSWNELIHPEDRSPVWDRIQEALAEKRPFKFVYRIGTASGKEKWVWEQGMGVFSEKGDLLALEGFISDITERKQAEEALQDSEEKLRSTLASMDDLVFVLDKDRVFCDYHQPTERPDLYIPSQAFLGKHYNEIMPPHVTHAFDEAIDAVNSSGTAQQVDYYLEMEGDIKWYSAKISSRKDASGEFTGVTVVSRDITNKKRTEEDLQKERDFSRTLIEASPAFFVAINADGKTLMMNQAMLSALGASADEVIGMEYLSKFVPEADREGLFVVFENLAKMHAPTMNENNVLTKDGRELLVEWHGTPILNDKGELDYFFGVGIDITERRQAEEEKKKLETQLQQGQKMEAIGTLAGGIAHDFNNILSAIIGYTELAQDNLEDVTKLSSFLNEVRTAGIRAKDLVQQILTFSRQAEKEIGPVQIHLIIKEAIKLLRASLPATIEIRQDIKSDSLIMGDPTQIHQIMMNLCTNAGHAIHDKGGVLEVDLENVELDSEFAARHPNLKPGAYMKLEVGDTGHGMSQEIMDRIFDPFYTTKEKGEGTGMGLSVVHGIINSYGGIIVVYSEPGKGSTFKVFFPVIEQNLEPEARVEKPVPRGSERILFVDDEKPIADMGRLTLESLGYAVTVRTSSLDALELFKAKPDEFDLVITDMTMPNMTGIDLAREIMVARPDIPIILCTGFSTCITEKTAKDIGIHAFISKPMLKTQIAEAIRNALDRTE